MRSWVPRGSNQLGRRRKGFSSDYRFSLPSCIFFIQISNQVSTLLISLAALLGFAYRQRTLSSRQYEALSRRIEGWKFEMQWGSPFLSFVQYVIETQKLLICFVHRVGKRPVWLSLGRRDSNRPSSESHQKGLAESFENFQACFPHLTTTPKNIHVSSLATKRHFENFRWYCQFSIMTVSHLVIQLKEERANVGGQGKTRKKKRGFNLPYSVLCLR